MRASTRQSFAQLVAGLVHVQSLCFQPRGPTVTASQSALTQLCSVLVLPTQPPVVLNSRAVAVLASRRELRGVLLLAVQPPRQRLRPLWHGLLRALRTGRDQRLGAAAGVYGHREPHKAPGRVSKGPQRDHFLKRAWLAVGAEERAARPSGGADADGRRGGRAAAVEDLPALPAAQPEGGPQQPHRVRQHSVWPWLASLAG